jgi:hypothetical protein
LGIFKKSGGGFLNGVEGTIESYKFATKEFTSRKTGNEYTKLSVELVVTPDGAEDSVQQFLDAGFFYPDNQAVSEDGLTLQAINDDGDVVDADSPVLREDSEFGQFVGSMIAAGFPEEELGVGVNFEPILGARVRFVRKVDEEATKKLGKRKGKDGKEYNRDLLLVDAVLGRAEQKAKGKAKAAPKTAAKGAKKAAAAGTDQLDAILIAVVEDSKSGSVEQKNLAGAFVRHALKNGIAQEDRKALQAQIVDAAYLEDAAARGIVAYDGTTVSAAA